MLVTTESAVAGVVTVMLCVATGVVEPREVFEVPAAVVVLTTTEYGTLFCGTEIEQVKTVA